MKISNQYQQEEPFEGNRSDQYFGIALFLEQGFFQTTRDTKFGAYRPDPRIHLFKRKLQEDLRRRIMRAAGEHGIAFDDAGSEWLKIVDAATNAATSFVESKTQAGRSKDRPLTVVKHTKIVEEAFKAALRVAAGVIHERETMKESWTTHPSLDFGTDDSIWIYVRRDNPLTSIYKIGQTKRRGKRDSSYQTHSAESELVAEYPETQFLTEKLIHRYFANKRFKREFFNLTKEDVALVTNPNAMRAALMAGPA